MERLSERLTAIEAVLKKLEPVEGLLERVALLENTIYTTKKVFTFQEACMYIGVSESMLYKLTSNKEIPHYKPRGKMLYFAKEELDAWLLQNYEPTVDDAMRMATEVSATQPFFNQKRYGKTKKRTDRNSWAELDENRLSDILTASQIKATDTYETPPQIIWIDNSTIATLGNFSASTGKAKAKKTFNVSAIVAASLAGRQVLNYRAHLPEGKRRILYVDTEQSRFHCHNVLERILRLAGLPTTTDNENLDFICLREYTPAVRIGVIDYALRQNKGYGLVIIDGIRDLMLERGVDVPLFTSDGPWRGCLRAGSLIEDDILATGNFGSRSKENLEALAAFHKEHGKNWPLMCMEFWDGWFNRYGEDVIKRDPQDLADCVREALELGASVNLYMFHGGTNFYFMNGCSARHTHDLPQVASYDYDAPLNEEGNPTEKYFALQRVVHELFPDAWQAEPLTKQAVAIDSIPATDHVSLFNVLDALSEPVSSQYPQPMEDLGQSYGFILYTTSIERDRMDEERIRVIDGRDRAQVFVEGELVATQYQEHIGEDIKCVLPAEHNRLDILVENMGRVGYGHKLLADTQHKGIRTGVCVDLHFITGWEQRCLPLTSIDGIDFSAGMVEGQPAFHRFEFTLDEPADTFIDTTGLARAARS